MIRNTAAPHEQQGKSQMSATTTGDPGGGCVFARRRGRLFPVFTADHVAQIVTLAVFVYNAAGSNRKATLAAAAGELATRESARRPFLRWCWARKTDPLTPGACNLATVMLSWYAEGMPDGLDLCPACGRDTWENHELDEGVSTPVGGVVATGRKVSVGRCRATGCGHMLQIGPTAELVVGRTLDLLA
ncbi:MAG TPA: hypothetical protein VFF65_03210 [Phycisphaerales bacterium]|nr:hypothetical protein [Phycisphaerales bacterium]